MSALAAACSGKTPPSGPIAPPPFADANESSSPSLVEDAPEASIFAAVPADVRLPQPVPAREDKVIDVPAGAFLRAYAATRPLTDGSVALPPAHETVLETDVRKALSAALAKRGVSTVDDAAALRISFDAEVEKRAPARARSALRIEPDRDLRDRVDQTDLSPVANPGFRPALGFGATAPRRQTGPMVRVTVTLLEDDARIWRGVARAPLGNRSRREVAEELTRSLVARWGEAIDIDPSVVTP